MRKIVHENCLAFAGIWRMRKGAPIEERPEFIYALAGFEYS